MKDVLFEKSLLVLLVCGLVTLACCEAAAQSADEQRRLRSNYYEFTLHEGAANHTDSLDLNAELALYSTGEALVAEIFIQDDQVLQGDYINLWFGLRRVGSPRRPDLYAFADSTLFCLDSPSHEQRTQEFLLKELPDPQVRCSDPHVEFRRSDLDSSSYYTHYDEMVADSVDKYIPTPSTIQSTEVFYGLTGYRIYTGLDSVALIQPESYALIEKAAGSSRADWLSYTSFERRPTGDGHTITITLPAEAIGFMHPEGYKRIYALMEVLDVDSEGITRFSTSSDSSRKNPNPYPFYQVDPPLTAMVHPLVSTYGSPAKSDVSRDLASLVPGVFFYTEAGWIPIAQERTPLSIYDQPMACSLEHITKCGFNRLHVFYEEAYRGDHHIALYSSRAGSVQVLNDTTSSKNISVIASFLFGDGALGQLTVSEETPHFRWHTANRWLHLFRNGTYHATLATYYDSLADDELLIELPDSLQFRPTYGADLQPWEHLVSLNPDGTGLVLDFPVSGRYQIRWDKDGSGIRSKKLDE